MASFSFSSVTRAVGDFLGLSPRNTVQAIEYDGGTFYAIRDFSANYAGSGGYQDKLNTILHNPAALYVVTLLCDLFTLGEFKMVDTTREDGDNEIETHALLDLLNNPNPMQSASQFKFDFMFWRLMGTAHLYSTSALLEGGNPRLYFLEPHLIEWPKWFEDNARTLFRNDDEIRQQILTYDKAGNNLPIRYDQLTSFHDVTNGIGSWWEGPSRVDAILEIVKNSQMALKSKTVTADFAGKFLVGSDVSLEETTKQVMSAADKSSIRSAMRSREQIFPVKTNPVIERFITDGTMLDALDNAFMTDAFLIAKVFNIPKDVTEMLGDSTYENQEKARASVISYNIEPSAEDFCAGLCRHFGVADNLKLELDFQHLPFVQVFENEKAETTRNKALAFDTLVRAGMTHEDAAALLDLKHSGEFNDLISKEADTSLEINDDDEQDDRNNTGEDEGDGGPGN